MTVYAPRFCAQQSQRSRIGCAKSPQARSPPGEPRAPEPDGAPCQCALAALASGACPAPKLSRDSHPQVLLDVGGALSRSHRAVSDQHHLRRRLHGRGLARRGKAFRPVAAGIRPRLAQARAHHDRARQAQEPARPASSSPIRSRGFRLPTRKPIPPISATSTTRSRNSRFRSTR
jgi:hypothetical protein